MNVKTVTGSTIQDALAKARSKFGEDVVLLESTPAADGHPARISVMQDDAAADDQSQDAAPTPASPPRVGAEAADAEAADAQTRARGYGPGQGRAQNVDRARAERSDERGASSDFGDLLSRHQDTGRGSFFPTSDSGMDASNGARDEVVDRRLSLLKNRLGGTGRGGRRTGAEQWVAHPFFSMLLDEGMRAETVTRLFDELAERGFDPESADRDELRWAFAQVFCRHIEVAPPSESGVPQVVVGQSGAGKTSLLLKLAAHESLREGEAVSVIHLASNGERDTAYQNPTELYRRNGIPVQNVHNRTEMIHALTRAEDLGRVLVDTPPLPLPLEEADPVLRRFESMLRPLQTHDVHFVVNASYAFESLNAERLQALPLTPDCATLTHLDQVAGWGRVAEWLIKIGLPIRFAVDSARISGGVRDFTLEWFVKEKMNL